MGVRSVSEDWPAMPRLAGAMLLVLGLLALAFGLFAGTVGLPVTEKFGISEARFIEGPLHRYQLTGAEMWDADPFHIVDDPRHGTSGTSTALRIGGVRVVEERMSTGNLRQPGASGFIHAGVINIYFAAPADASPDTEVEVTYSARLNSPVFAALMISSAALILCGLSLALFPGVRAGAHARDALLILFLAGSLAALWLWTQGISVHQDIDPERVNPHAGVSYIYRVDSPWPLHVPQVDRGNAIITGRVYENGVALGPADALSNEIREIGEGRHVMANDSQLRFTASDNSDPRQNGRSYHVVLLAFLSQWAALAIIGTAVLIFLAGVIGGSAGLSAASFDKAPLLVGLGLPAAVALIVLGYLGWLIKVDALHYFSPPSDNDYYVRDEPARMAGLVRTYPYDGIIIGSSMSQNFYMSQATEILGMPILNATVAGSFPKDQYYIAELALKTRRPDVLIWDYHLTGWHQSPDSMRPQVFPFGLYDPNPLYRLEYAFSLQAWLDANAALKARRGFGNMALDDVNKWGSRLPFGRDLVGRRYCPRLKDPPGPMNEANIRAVMQTHMKPLIEAYPATQFVFFIPPYSGAMHSRLGGIMTDTVGAARIMLEELGGFPNVRIFDFQAIGDFTADPDIYRDAVHYNLEIHTRMLEWIAEGRREVTAANIDEHERKLQPLLADVARRMDEAMIPVCAKLEAEG